MIQWFNAVKKYIAQKPTTQSRFEFMTAIEVPTSVVKEINTLVDVLRADKHVVSVIEKFWNEFDSLLV